MQIAISIGVGGLLFLCGFLSGFLVYREGIRTGMMLNKGQSPPKLRNPVQVVKSMVAEAKAEEEQASLMQDHARMMQYDGFLPEERQVT